MAEEIVPVEAISCTEGREQRFSSIPDIELDRAYRVAGHTLGDAADAEDATQEALTMAWASWHTLRMPGAAQRWFWRILVNCCRSRAFRIRRGGEPAVAVYDRPDDAVAFQRTYFVLRNAATLVARAGATSMS